MEDHTHLPGLKGQEDLPLGLVVPVLIAEGCARGRVAHLDRRLRFAGGQPAGGAVHGLKRMTFVDDAAEALDERVEHGRGAPAVGRHGLGARAGFFGGGRAVGEIPQVGLAALGDHLPVLMEDLEAVAFEAVGEGRPRQLAPDERHDPAVDVRTADQLVIAKDPIGKRRVDAEPRGEGARRLRASLIFAQDRHSHLMRGEAPVDGHRVAQAQLLGLVHAVDDDRRELVKMGVESAVEEQGVGPRAHALGHLDPSRRILAVSDLLV